MHAAPSFRHLPVSSRCSNGFSNIGIDTGVERTTGDRSWEGLGFPDSACPAEHNGQWDARREGEYGKRFQTWEQHTGSSTKKERYHARRKGTCYSTTELNQAAVRVMIVQKVLIFMFLGSEHTRARSRRGRGIAPAPIFPKVLDYFPPYPPGGSRS